MLPCCKSRADAQRILERRQGGTRRSWARGGERRAVPTTNLKFRNGNCQDDDDVAFCLVVISARCFGTEAVHLRSTNLSIVSRQISRNITDIFRYRTLPVFPFPSCSGTTRPRLTERAFEALTIFFVLSAFRYLKYILNILYIQTIFSPIVYCGI